MTELDPKHYQENSSTQYELSHEILDEITFAGDEIILDIGCGDGRVTAEIARKVPRGKVIGIDPSSTMIAHAKSRYADITFHVQLVEEFQLVGQVDKIFVLNTLHWIRDPKKALRNIAELLKPGGILYILTYPKESPYWGFLEETLKSADFASYFNLAASETILPAQLYRYLIEAYKFEIMKFSLEEKIGHYASEQELIDYIKGWLPSYVPLPPTLEEKFLQQAVSKAKSHSLSQKEIQLPYYKLIIIAQKF